MGVTPPHNMGQISPFKQLLFVIALMLVLKSFTPVIKIQMEN